MNFVAIDFETANEKRHSPCSLGLCLVENNKIVLEKYWLIKPHELRFNPMNIWIHGIREGDVIDAPEFNTLWVEEILPLIKDKLVVAHNAAFDMSVLRNTLDLYQIPYPTLEYCCTMVMSRHFYPFLDNAKLNTVNKHLGYTFNHHHAGADAAACANILLHIAKELDLDNIEDLATQIGVKIGKLFPGGYHSAGTNGGGLTSKHPIGSPLESPAPLYSCQTDFFRNRVVAFTGPLSSMSRSEAIGLVEKCGGDYSPSVTRKTSIVVTGMKDPLSLSPSQMSTKLRRAVELIGRGQDIQFIDESTLLKLLE